MRCEDCLAKLDEYVEGELDEAATSQISAHLTACQGCSHHFRVLKHELDIYVKYLLDIEATPALWTGLRAGIEEHKTTNIAHRTPRMLDWLAFPFIPARLHKALVISLMLMTLGIVASVVRYVKSWGPRQLEDISQNSKDPGATSPLPISNALDTGMQEDAEGQAGKPGPDRISSNTGQYKGQLSVGAVRRAPARANSKPEAPRRNPGADEAIRRTERQYLSAITILSRDFNRRRAQLNPNSVAQLESAIASIDRTIMATQRAVKEHPDDALVVQYMMLAYARKVEILRQITTSPS